MTKGRLDKLQIIGHIYCVTSAYNVLRVPVIEAEEFRNHIFAFTEGHGLVTFYKRNDVKKGENIYYLFSKNIPTLANSEEFQLKKEIDSLKERVGYKKSEIRYIEQEIEFKKSKLEHLKGKGSNDNSIKDFIDKDESVFQEELEKRIEEIKKKKDVKA